MCKEGAIPLRLWRRENPCLIIIKFYLENLDDINDTNQSVSSNTDTVGLDNGGAGS